MMKKEEVAAAEDFLDEHRDYLEHTLNPMLDTLVQQVLEERPLDPLPFLLRSLVDLLKKRGNVDDLEQCAVDLNEHIRELKTTDSDYDDKVVQQERVALFRRQLTQTAAAKGELDDNVDDVFAVGLEGDADSITDSDEDSDEDADEVGSLIDAPRSYTLNRPRHSVSAEAYGEYNQRREFTPPYYPKTFEEQQKISAVFENLFLFQALGVRDVHTVLHAMEEIRFTEPTRIIQQGDDGDALYVIAEGTFHCHKIFNFRPDVPLANQDPETMVKVCGPGDLFGELALLYNVPRAASVESIGPALIWKLDRETFSHIVKDSASKKREMYQQFLSNVELLRGCDFYERGKIADALKTAVFQDGSKIVTQGDSGDTFYFIEEGRAVAVKSFKDDKPPMQVKQYEAGDYFGELAILRDAPRAASVLAIGKVTVAYLNRHAFKRLFGPVEAILEHNARNYPGRAESVVLKSTINFERSMSMARQLSQKKKSFNAIPLIDDDISGGSALQHAVH